MKEPGRNPSKKMGEWLFFSQKKGSGLDLQKWLLGLSNHGKGNKLLFLTRLFLPYVHDWQKWCIANTPQQGTWTSQPQFHDCSVNLFVFLFPWTAVMAQIVPWGHIKVISLQDVVWSKIPGVLGQKTRVLRLQRKGNIPLGSRKGPKGGKTRCTKIASKMETYQRTPSESCWSYYIDTQVFFGERSVGPVEKNIGFKEHRCSEININVDL